METDYSQIFLRFEVDYSNMNPRTGGNIKTTIVKIDINKFGSIYKEVLGTVNGLLTYDEEREYREVYC
jgi:hypothetical protein